MSTDQTPGLGPTSDIAADPHGLRWTQIVDGSACQVSVALKPETLQAADTMNGVLKCGHGQMPFVLHRNKH